MEKEKFKNNDEFVLFAEAGFIAINQADEDAALKLFHAAEAINPKHFLPKLGMGYLHFLKLDLKKAGTIFEEILTIEPNNEMAKAMLGLSLALSPSQLNKGEKMLEESARSAKDPSVKTMATTAVDFVEKFVKKSGKGVMAGPASTKPAGKGAAKKEKPKQ